METTFTRYAIRNLLTGIEVEDPIVQVISIKPISYGRYRCCLSDSEYHTTAATFVSSFEERILSKDITENSIIQVTQFEVRTVVYKDELKKIIVISECNVLIPGEDVGQVIGHPDAFDPNRSDHATDSYLDTCSMSSILLMPSSGSSTGSPRKLSSCSSDATIPIPSSPSTLFGKFSLSPTPSTSKETIPLPGTSNVVPQSSILLTPSPSKKIKLTSSSEETIPIRSSPNTLMLKFSLSPTPSTSKETMTLSGTSNVVTQFPSQSTDISERSSDSLSCSDNVNAMPIQFLNQLSTRWTILGTVTRKSYVYSYSRKNAPCKMFYMHLCDESDEIKARCYNKECDKFFSFFEEGKSYYISGGDVKFSDKTYTSLSHTFEILFNERTKVQLCNQSRNVPPTHYNFVSFGQIEHKDINLVIDAIGVCPWFGILRNVTQRSTGFEVKRRKLELMDGSGLTICVTLWNSHAESFNGYLYPIVAFKDIRVNGSSTRELSSTNNTIIQLNPDIKEAHELRKWYILNGYKQKTYPMFGEDKLKLLAEARVEDPSFFASTAVIIFIDKERCLYAGCPARNCNKKVIDLNNGLYKCEKCKKEYHLFHWRLLLKVTIVDATDEIEATIFHDLAEKLLGCSAEDLASAKESDTNRFEEILCSPLLKDFTFNFKASIEYFNNKKLLKTTVQSFSSLCVIEYNKMLISGIKALSQNKKHHSTS